jgi:catechol 2,3-dioxygenase-like lactoylglutathione lyase family enzyme
MSVAAIECLHLNHFNLVVEGFDASLDRFVDLFGAQVMKEMPRKEWRAGIIMVGGVIIELFAPHEFLLNARYGPHFLGVEYQTAGTVDEAREAVLSSGARIARDIGAAFHVHPADTFGVAFEFFGQNFHTREDPAFREPFKPLEYWRDEHSMGCVGLKRYTVAVADIDAAAQFFASFVGARLIYETRRAAVAAHAVGLKLADSVVELITPVGDGVISRHLSRFGDGIRSVVLVVNDLPAAQQYLTGCGTTLYPGDAEDTLAIAANDTCGLLFEVSE